MVSGWIIAALLAACSLGEWLHARRSARLAHLAFGPAGRPRAWVSAAAPVRVLAMGLLGWGLLVLLAADRAPWEAGSAAAAKPAATRHLVIALDVSPSMQLPDAGPSGTQQRAERAREVLRSILARLDLRRMRVSVVAFYSDARPVVIDTFDPEVVANILDDLPLEYAFKPGKTNLYAGVKTAGEVGKAWPVKSATLLLVSDGDTLPAREIPLLPPAYGGNLIIGVGNAYHGMFIDGHSSRQDADSLRQLAMRIGGDYFDANGHHLPSADLLALGQWLPVNQAVAAGLRELALGAAVVGAALLTALGLGLGYWGARDFGTQLG